MYAELVFRQQDSEGGIEIRLEPEVKKELADEVVKEYNVSISRTCKLMDIHRSYFYYTMKKDDSEVDKVFARKMSTVKALGRSSIDSDEAESKRTYDTTTDRGSSPRRSRNGATASVQT